MRFFRRLLGSRTAKLSWPSTESNTESRKPSEALVAACIAGDPVKAEEAFTRGANVNHVGIGGMSSLHYACKKGNTPLVLTLLAKGADPEIRTRRGANALHTAALFQQREAVKALLSHGVNVDSADKAGWTALHFAAKNADAEIAQTLLRSAANANARTEMGQTPLHLYPDEARVSDDSVAIQELAAILGQSPGDAQSMMVEFEASLGLGAAKKTLTEYPRLLRVLLEGAADPTLKDNNGLTPYQLAKMKKRSEVLKAMKQAGIEE